MAMFMQKARLLNLTLEYVNFLRRVDEILFWIREKEAFVTSEEFGQDLEHVEALQKKYDEFMKVCFRFSMLTILVLLGSRVSGGSSS